MINHKKTLINSILLSFLFIFLIAFSAQANVQIKAGRLNYQEEMIELFDGVTIFWEDYEITAVRGEVDRPESITYLYENVEVLFDRGKINSNNLTIYMDDNELLFTEQVYLNYQREDDDNPLEMQTSHMLYNTEQETFKMDEPLEIVQEGRTINSGAGSYSEEEEMFYFLSGVEIVEEDGDRITSDTAQLDLQEGDLFTAEGNVEIELDL